MNVILLGPPGVGKGTQGVLLCERRGLTHVSTGDLLRKARSEGTPLGLEAQAFMERGDLVPDSVIIGMVRELLEALPDDAGVVFDGFPRTVAQAEALDTLLADLGRAVDRVVVIHADDEVLVQRLSGRRSCPDCGAVYNVHFNPPTSEGACDRCGQALRHRVDDQPETVRNRLEVYRRQTEPLIAFYETHPTALRRVEGDRPVDEVQAGLQRALDE
ncbi:MAG: adenylate kinase [Gemmatimonadetes bacterium]|nr:adenylate kinase [Gemmatimonadota bacterium]NNK64580.1 adenylate kinase [Gemmatimonadota bacterium]